MRVLLAFLLGAWLTLVLISLDPHLSTPGSIGLAQILTLPLVIVLTVVIVRGIQHDGDQHGQPGHDTGRQQAANRYPR